jgi:8-oxo-dGTP pyrophosphatase MutT (NUDIX family)
MFLEPKPEPKKQYERTAGFIIFRKTDQGIKFLLMYKGGSYWNFPKGHLESGETDLEAAFREVYEETGLKKSDLKIIPEFRTYERFSFKTDTKIITKNIVLYLAETKKANIYVDPNEHYGFAWFLYKEATKIIGPKYVGIKKALRQAMNFIQKKEK